MKVVCYVGFYLVAPTEDTPAYLLLYLSEIEMFLLTSSEWSGILAV